MSMSVGSGGGLTNEPNVTPMIDVLLVLLIIFMIIQPRKRMAIDLQLPVPQPPVSAPTTPPDQIVLEIKADGSYFINTKPVPHDQLAQRIKEIYEPRPDKVIFIKGDPKVKYDVVIAAMDVARGSGVTVIGIPPVDLH